MGLPKSVMAEAPATSTTNSASHANARMRGALLCSVETIGGQCGENSGISYACVNDDPLRPYGGGSRSGSVRDREAPKGDVNSSPLGLRPPPPLQGRGGLKDQSTCLGAVHRHGADGGLAAQLVERVGELEVVVLLARRAGLMMPASGFLMMGSPTRWPGRSASVGRAILGTCSSSLCATITSGTIALRLDGMAGRGSSRRAVVSLQRAAGLRLPAG